MKRLISLMMVMALLAPVCVINTLAALPPKQMGDLNGDWNVDIIDVTLIQSILAQIHDKTPQLEYLGDVDQDGALSIIDATNIQLWLAGLIGDEDIDVGYVSTDIYFHDAYPDYESGKAMAGVPVTFTMNAKSSVQPLKYSLYVGESLLDNKCVATTTENTITYTFEEAGTYYVVIAVRNIFNGGINRIGYYEYEVVEPYEYVNPEIISAYITGKHMDTVVYDKEDMKACVEVKGGVAPYQYKFELTRAETTEYDAKDITITQDFSEKNYFELENIDYDDICFRDYGHSSCDLPCVLNITVKDANGAETTKTMNFVYTYDYPIG